MNEVKKPKKPVMFYYCVMLALIVLFNTIILPWFTARQIKEVD